MNNSQTRARQAAAQPARRTRQNLMAGGAALALAAVVPAVAQAQSLGEFLGRIVVTASGFEQAVADAPASVTVITAEDLATGAYRDLTDAIQEAQGVVSTGVANEQDIQIRGLPGSYTLMLVDGRRVSTRESRPNGSSGIEQSNLPPLNMIERIEVVRGPMSSLYGSDAMGGVINVITRPVASTWSGSVTVEGTLQSDEQFGNSAGTSFEVSGPLIENRLGLQLWGRAFNRSEDELVGGIMGAQERNLGMRLTYTPVEGQELRFEAGSSRVTNFSTEGRIVADGTDSSERLNQRDYLSLSHTARFGEIETRLGLQVEEGTRTNWARASGDADFVQNTRVPVIRNITLDGQLTMPWQGYGNHTLVAGFQVTDARLTDQGHLDVHQNMSSRQYAVFAENEWQITDTFSITGGLRYDRHEVYGGHFSPRLYAVWNATDALTIKGGISTGFTAPSIRQIAPGYYMPTQRGAGLIAANPDLRPETSTNIEIGAVYETERFEFSATAFYTEFSDKVSNANSHQMIDPITGTIIDPLGPDEQCSATTLAPYAGYSCLWQAFNIDDATVQGVELSMGWSVSDTLRLRGSYSYTDSEQLTGDYAGFPLTRTPRHRATLRADWTTPVEGLAVWGAGTYHGAEVNAGARIGSNGEQVTIGGATGRRYGSYSTFDIGATYEVRSNVVLSAAVYNVFDRVQTQEQHNTVGEGRRAWLGLTTRF